MKRLERSQVRACALSICAGLGLGLADFEAQFFTLMSHYLQRLP